MTIRKWHWARLKKDLRIDDSVLLNCIKSDLFIIPEGTLVWVCLYINSIMEPTLQITISDIVLEKNRAAYQAVYNVHYSDLLEPLE